MLIVIQDIPADRLALTGHMCIIPDRLTFMARLHRLITHTLALTEISPKLITLQE